MSVPGGIPEAEREALTEPVGLTDDVIAMLRKRPIICCGTNEWYQAPNTPEHTMSVLAEATRVLYVEPFGSPLTHLRSSLFQKRFIPLRSGVRKLTEGLFVFAPPPVGLPFQHRSDWARAANTSILARMLRRIAARLEMHEPILWIYTYHLANLVGKLGEVAAVYDCLEQEQAFASPRMRSRVGALENELSRRVDVVFAISPEVRSERMQSNENTHVVRAGANIRHFQRGATKLAAPRALENVRRPILGYFGQLDPWKVDARLIRDVAMLRNDWSIVLVGHITRGFPIDLIEGLPNVQILGSRDYREIPSFLQNFDVCLMPFLVNEATLHGDHVKLYEYLASGKPVVSTDVPSARRFHELVLTSSSLETFIENVEAALLEGEDRWRTRVATARANSYHARVTDKIRALAPVLNGA